MEQKKYTLNNTQWFYHTGGLGDIVYSLPTVKALGGGGFVLGTTKAEYESIKPLLMSQPYIKACHHLSTFGLPANFVDLTKFRNHPLFTRLHIVELHAQMYGAKIDGWRDGWLDWVDSVALFGGPAPEYSIINVTPRYRDRFHTWDKEVKRLHRDTELINFIGTEAEASEFMEELNPKNRKLIYRHLNTPNLLVAAQWIKGAKNFSGNQSVMLAIRQSLGMSYSFEQSPNHLDTEQGDNPRERIINPFTRRLHLATVCVKKMLFDNKQKRYHA